MSKKVTLATIADAVGVSRMTVSNAFSRPDQLSAELRTRILATAEEMGYCGPDPVARVLSTGRTGTVGVLLTDTLGYAFSDEVATQFLSGVADVLEEEALALTVLPSPRQLGQPGPVTTAMVDGLIVYSVDTDSPGLREARRRGIPLVFADQVPEAGVPGVVVDDRAGARAAARHIRSLGHRRVAVVVEAMGEEYGIVRGDTPVRHHVPVERLAGWREGLGTQRARAALHVNVPVNLREEGRIAAQKVLAEPVPPTAFLCLTDALAVGVMDELAARGLDVPGDVSVVGFDDSRLASWCSPTLTTVRQPVVEKGRTAARLLVEQLGLAGTVILATTPGPSSSFLPTELVIRDSTGQHQRSTTRREPAVNTTQQERPPCSPRPCSALGRDDLLKQARSALPDAPVVQAHPGTQGPARRLTADLLASAASSCTRLRPASAPATQSPNDLYSS